MDKPLSNTDESQEKIDFFLISAHELRTSLSAMKWLFKMLLDGDFGELNETQSSMLSQAKESNNRMIDLVNEIMTTVQSSDPAIPFLSVPVSLSELTEESIKDFTSEATQKGVRLRYDSPATNVIIIGDANKLRIVLHNLMENAIKYADPNSDISISLKVEDGRAIFKIANHGVLIPENEHPHIFQKFYRASTASKNFKGAGLGLYATKNIVSRHNGELSFISNEADGTVFTLDLEIG